MTADPRSVPLARVRAAYEVLGLDPAGWDDTEAIMVTPERVIVIRVCRDYAGRRLDERTGVVVEVDHGGAQ